MQRIVLYSRMWRSGTGLYAQGLADGLMTAGVPLTFIAPRGAAEPPLPGVRRICPPREFTEAETVSRPRRALRSLVRIGGGLGALLVARASSRNFIVTIPEPLLFWLPVLLMLRLTGAHVVFICHDPEPHAWRLPGALQILERTAHRASYRLASRIVVLARATKTALMKEFAIDGETIAVIPHGAFPVAYAGAVPGKRMLLAFGTIRRNKQIHVAIEAVALARGAGCDCSLVVAGGADANDPDYVELCRSAAALLSDAVCLEIGYASDARVDALLLPYADFESQSGVAVIAGIAGRPVICAAAGGIPDLIHEGLAATVIADPVSPSEIAAGICRFFETSADEWTRRATDGRAALKTALAWREVGGRFAALFAAPDR
jgi:glycogen(starch) synthase